MADPFAPSTDPDIPTPTREDLLPHVHGSVRDQLVAGTLDARHAENEWIGARRAWDEGHKRDAERRRTEAKQSAAPDPTTQHDANAVPYFEQQGELALRMAAAAKAKADQAMRDGFARIKEQALSPLLRRKRPVAKEGMQVEDTLPPMRDKAMVTLQKTVDVKTVESADDSDANRSPVMLEFFERTRRYRGDLYWLGNALKTWPAVLAVFAVAWGGGLGAMQMDQYFIAIGFFTAAFAVLAIKGVSETKERRQAVLIVVLAMLFLAAHVVWVVYTHQHFSK